MTWKISWPEADDHAKMAISARSETTHFICVGDINFTVAMRKRSGGTVAFQCEPLWTCISEILVGVTTHLKPGSKAEKLQAARQSASAKAAAAKAAAKKAATGAEATTASKATATARSKTAARGKAVATTKGA